MKLTGKNLRRVRYAVSLAVSEYHNEVATCPDPELYAKELKEAIDKRHEYMVLLGKIDHAITVEGMD